MFDRVYSTGVPFPPVILSKEKELPFSDFKLIWSTPENSGCTLALYTVYYRKIQSRGKGNDWLRINATVWSNSLSALPLECETEYEFAMTAWNERGESDLSQPWKVKSTTGTSTVLKHERVLSTGSFQGKAKVYLSSSSNIRRVNYLLAKFKSFEAK